MKENETNNEPITVNGLTFLEFCNELGRNFKGFKIFDKRNGRLMYKYQLFWTAQTMGSIQKNYNLIKSV